MAKVIAVYSVKGGVGKTSLAVNLAAISSLCAGHRTLLWDLDAQGSASFLCGANPQHGTAQSVFSRETAPQKLVSPSAWSQLDVIGADTSLRAVEHVLFDAGKPKRLRRILEDLAPSYDRIILDCPPGLTELSDQVFKAADIVLMPLVPTALGLRAMAQIITYLEEWGSKAPILVPIISMVDRRKSLHRTFLAEHPDWLSVPQSSIIEKMTIKQAPVEVFASRSPPAALLRAIWHEVDQRLQTIDKSEGKNARRGRPRIPRAGR